MKYVQTLLWLGSADTRRNSVVLGGGAGVRAMPPGSILRPHCWDSAEAQKLCLRVRTIAILGKML